MVIVYFDIIFDNICMEIDIKMKVTINISKEDVRHIKNCDSIYDACDTTQKVFIKLRKALKWIKT